MANSSQDSSTIDQMTRTAQRARAVLRETTQALESVWQTTKQATADTQTTNEQLMASQEAHIHHLAERASRAIDHVNDATNQSVVTISEMAEKAKASLNEDFLRAKLDDSVSETVQRSLTIARQNWLEAHPLLAWLMAHPLLSLVIIFFLFWIFWGLLTAVGRLTEQAWLAILQSPLKLGRWSVGQIPRGLQRFSGGSDRLLNPSGANEHEQRLTDILGRLETLNQEQTQLMKEMQTILASQRANQPSAHSRKEHYPDNAHIQ